jgi:hypothetical protein
VTPSARLSAQQDFVANLYVDARSRDVFTRAGTSHPPGSAGDAALDGLDLDRLCRFATSLRFKRAREARDLLPFTSVALSRRFTDTFEEATADTRPMGLRKPLADAMSLAAALRTSDDVAVREAARFDWESHALRFRLVNDGGSPARCDARRRRGVYVSLRSFRFAFPAIAGRPPDVASWPRRRTVVLFVNVFGRCVVRYW